MTDEPLYRPTDAESRSEFWENVHDDKDVDGVSWWQSVPGLSLGLVDETKIATDRGVIDVGAGWSTLIDHLFERGYEDLTAIDLSATALQTVRDRLPVDQTNVVLDVADILDFRPGRTYTIWHDRAVFHFLTEPEERDEYRESLTRCLEPGGYVVVATFGPDGPLTCSGLPIVRYTHEELAAEFPGFELISTTGEEHITPWGTNQQFTAILLKHQV